MPPSARHAALFAAQFFAFGVTLPFLPAVLAARGLEAAEVALVLSAGAAVRLVAGPLGGWAADALFSPRGVLAVGALVGALASAGFGLAAGLVLLLLAQVVMSAATAPVVPLSDAVTLAAARRGEVDYGRARAAGSIAFILAALLAGQAVAAFGAVAAVPLIVAGFLGTAIAAALLPRDGEAGGRPAPGIAALAVPLRIPAFRRLLVVAALIQGSHAFYYGFGTLHWQAEGLGAGLIGLLWAVGVLAEIALFLWGRGLVARLGPVRLCLLAAAAGVVRWGVTAVTADPWVLVPLQVLHAATFGAQHLASMQVLARVVPGQGAGTAQTVLAALGPGLAIGLLTAASGPLFQAFGGGGYWVMAALCVAAVPACLMLGRVLPPR